MVVSVHMGHKNEAELSCYFHSLQLAESPDKLPPSALTAVQEEGEIGLRIFD